MKILAHQCRAFGYAAISPSKAAVAIDPELIGIWRYQRNCLLLQIGIEAHDAQLIARAAKEIRRTARQTRPRILAINAFSQLADPAARCSPDRAQTILAALVARLTQRPEDLPVVQLPFGWNKSFRLSVAAGEWEQHLIHL